MTEATLRWLRSGYLRTTVLLLAVLALHFGSRQYFSRSLPLAQHHIYARSYNVSLSLLAGRGFNELGGPQNDTPFKRFINLQSDSLSRADLDDYLAGFDRPETPTCEHLNKSRILDLYLAAVLWKVFGISWSVLFTFYVLVSTVACAMIFFIARQLSGSSAAGLLAALAFVASPLECLLGTWSLRDMNPTWCAIACCWFLVCVVDRARSQIGNYLSFFGFGVVSIIGLGWRPDILILPPFFGLAMLAYLWQKRRGWRCVLAAACLMASGVVATYSGILALCPHRLPAISAGAHVAYYADAIRCARLGIENTFQVPRCDTQTLITARLCEDQDDAEQMVPYLTPPYATQCKSMFLLQASHHLFNWIKGFPRFYGEVITGFPLEDLGIPMTTPFRGRLLHWTNCLFFVGIFAVIVHNKDWVLTFFVAAFSAYYALVLFLTLPEAKHLGPVLLPLTVFTGIGARWLLGGACYWNWTRESIQDLRLGVQRAGKGILAAALLWLVSLALAYPVSAAQRRDYLHEVAERIARSSSDASELLIGDRIFCTSILPAQEPELVGYLFKLQADEQPGNLVCQHLHFMQAWGSPSVNLSTKHRLLPNRVQYFFVTALQGSKYGDPRPYKLHVAAHGDSRIVECRRVSLDKWRRLPLSTVFQENDHLAGSPGVPGPHPSLAFLVATAFRSNTGGQPTPFDPEKKQYRRITQPFALGAPIDHLLGRDSTDNTAHIASNNGFFFTAQSIDAHPPRGVAADFNGDGVTDLLDVDPQSGKVNVWRYEGWRFAPHDWGRIPSGLQLVDLRVADVNGDGLDDLVGRDKGTGEIHVALSTGTEFIWHCFGTWDARITWRNVLTADFNGDGRADLCAVDAQTGALWIALSNGRAFQSSLWARCDHVSLDWYAGDFNGDGRADLVAQHPDGGRCLLALAQPDHFVMHTWTTLGSDLWQDVRVGDFNGDGKDDLCGFSRSQGHVLALSETGRFACHPQHSGPGKLQSVVVGDFDGDGCIDIAGTLPNSANLQVGTWKGSQLVFQPWGAWPSADIEAVQTVHVWRSRQGKPPGQNTSPVHSVPRVSSSDSD